MRGSARPRIARPFTILQLDTPASIPDGSPRDLALGGMAHTIPGWRAVCNARHVCLFTAYRVAQVRHSDALDHRWVAENHWGAGEVVEQSNARAKKDRGEVDLNLVEEPRVKELSDDVRAVNPHRLPGRGRLGLTNGALEAVCYEVDCRVRPRPSVRYLVGQHERWPPRMVTAPAMGLVEGVSTGEDSTQFGPQSADALRARFGELERHGIRASCAELDIPRTEVPSEHFIHAIVAVGNEAVQGCRHESHKFRRHRPTSGCVHWAHGLVPLPPQHGAVMNARTTEANYG